MFLAVLLLVTGHFAYYSLAVAMYKKSCTKSANFEFSMYTKSVLVADWLSCT